METLLPESLVKTKTVYVYTCSRCLASYEFGHQSTATQDGWRIYDNGAQEERSLFMLCPLDARLLETFISGGAVLGVSDPNRTAL